MLLHTTSLTLALLLTASSGVALEPAPRAAAARTPQPAALPRKVAATTLPRLVKFADVIVVAQVDAVHGAPGEEVAEARVESVWKGSPGDTVSFRAHGTWACDTSDAEVGERAVLFLSAVDEEHGYRHVRHAGRGNMPLREVDGAELATIWVNDVRLPEDLETLDGGRGYDSIRSLPVSTLAALVQDYLAQQSEAGVAALREELLAMYAVDQRARDIEHMLTLPKDAQQTFMAEGAAADARHLERMKEIVYVHDWPDHALVGEQASHAAFTLVQHADADPDFQWRMLWPLRKAVERGEASAAELAYLTDRVNVARGKPQVYGTQYAVQTDASGAAIADADGKLTYLLPVVESVDRLDERRAEAGLGPWIEYERRMAASQGREPAARPRVAGE